MARTLSQDLRDRVFAAIDNGLSCRAAAARFGVSVSSAIRWRRRALEHDQAVAKPRGGDRHSGKIEAHGGFIRELIAEQGDMTLFEVQARLIERGAPVGIGTVHRFFVRHGMTRKKHMARHVCKGNFERVRSVCVNVYGLVSVLTAKMDIRTPGATIKTQATSAIFCPGFPDADRLSGHLHDPSCKHRWPMHEDACGRSGYAATG